MNKVFAAVCIAALLLLCAACGTVRSIEGKHKGNPPRLLAVSPTQVVSGQTGVTFTAQVLDAYGHLPGTNGNILYFWDFGGGTDPNTSTDASPVVDIRDGTRSPYSARLVLTDTNTGDAKEYDFQLFVTPLAVGSVVPTTVVAGSSATFSAIVQSGVVTNYSWDFGGGADPGASSEQAPAETITSAPGTYHAILYISNKFESLQFPFTLTVTAAPGP